MVRKICFAASSGGHLEEIAGLSEIRDEYESFLITEKGAFLEKIFCRKVYHVNQINRKELLFIPKFIWLFIISFMILIKEKPDCIISTGALMAYPVCLLGKIMGKKVIYIESFARIDTPSLTGRLVYKFADLFIVQWKEMLKFYKKAKVGSLYL